MIDIDFEFEGIVWAAHSDKTCWHIINLPDETSKDIRAFTKHKTAKKGFGSVKVTAQIGQSRWNTSVFPSKEGHYIIPLKAAIRKAENISKGDTVHMRLEIGI